MNYIEKMAKEADAITTAFTEKLTAETRLIMKLEMELIDCRSELCLKCGKDGEHCERIECKWR